MVKGSEDIEMPQVAPQGSGMTDYGLIELEGTQNTRDQGGMEAVTGQRVRARKLIRSDQLSGLKDEDIRVLIDEIGLRTVIDLRTDVERESTPDPIDRMEGVKFINLPVLDGGAVGLTHEHSIRSLWEEFKKLKADPIELISSTYPKMLLGDAGIKAYKTFFQVLLDQEDGAVLWHCSEGKDRTGVASMLILHVLGVPPETIMQDYLATNLFARKKLKRIASDLEKAHIAERSDEALIAFVTARTEYMAAAMRALEDSYGSLDAYISDALGLTAHDRERLAEKYLF